MECGDGEREGVEYSRPIVRGGCVQEDECGKDRRVWRSMFGTWSMMKGFWKREWGGRETGYERRKVSG